MSVASFATAIALFALAQKMKSNHTGNALLASSPKDFFRVDFGRPFFYPNSVSILSHPECRLPAAGFDLRFPALLMRAVPK